MKNVSTLGTITLALALLSSCASMPPAPEEVAEFSDSWKAAEDWERGSLVRIDLIRDYLAGKGEAAAAEFLGRPDSLEGRSYLYRLGWLPEGRNWYLVVSFDEERRVDGVWADR
jgi:hypothetical protein